MADRHPSPPTARTMLGLLWDSLRAVNGAIGGGIAIGVGFIVWRVAPTATVSAWIILPASLIVILLFWVFTDALLAASRLIGQAPNTRIIAVTAPYVPYKHTKCVLIVNWSASAAQPVGSQVAVSLVEREFHERPLGSGTVRGVQSNGYYVVTLDACYDGVDESLRQLLAPNTDLPTRLRIGPAMSLQYVGGGQNVPASPGQAESINENGPSAPPTMDKA